MKCVPVHHGIPAVLHRDEPWLHRHSENGALTAQDDTVTFFKKTSPHFQLLPMAKVDQS